ncbi:MAG: hypothetical protein NTW08_03885 [Gammaproteobacteria bacterium]|nr:hypothetical protein [Gammaproteobacteria bacterium]
MNIQSYYQWGIAVTLALFTPLVLAAELTPGSNSLYAFVPTTPTTVHVPGFGSTTIEYQVTNQTKRARTLALSPAIGVTQNTDSGHCANPFYLTPNGSCLLSLSVSREHFIPSATGTALPEVCKTPSSKHQLCAQASLASSIQLKLLGGTSQQADFPYGSAPEGDVCVSTSSYYATPETMLGSWAMLQGIALDASAGALPTFMTPDNTVYAVGTAALGQQLGISNCDGGCNQLNGYCFAVRFNGKSSYPYMIFQSVNIAANNNSFDIYMAGGGAGAYPNQCKVFWGTGTSVDWSFNIENSTCDTYFNGFSTIDSAYTVTYNSVVHPAKQTLIDACAFASAGASGFNTQNWSNLSVVPVTCPQALTQVTGVQQPSDITTVGTQKVYALNTLTTQNFDQSTIAGVTTTQMQDCNTPSSGYCGNVSQSVPNYQASISATLTAPLLTSPPPATNYCQPNPTITGFCSWSHGLSDGSDYCNQSESICISCGNSAQWCKCDNGVLLGCSNT